MVTTCLPMNAGGVGLIPYQGAKTLHALPHPLPKKNISKRSNILTNSVKTLNDVSFKFMTKFTTKKKNK